MPYVKIRYYKMVLELIQGMDEIQKADIIIGTFALIGVTLAECLNFILYFDVSEARNAYVLQ